MTRLKQVVLFVLYLFYNLLQFSIVAATQLLHQFSLKLTASTSFFCRLLGPQRMEVNKKSIVPGSVNYKEFIRYMGRFSNKVHFLAANVNK